MLEETVRAHIQLDGWEYGDGAVKENELLQGFSFFFFLNHITSYWVNVTCEQKVYDK